MAGFNNVVLIGNLARDPELKQTATGISVCNISLGVNRPAAKPGEQAVDFIECVFFKHHADFICRYLKKGACIAVRGKIQTRSWTDKQGNKRTATEVVCDDVQSLSNGNGGNKNANGGGEPRVSIPPTANAAPYVPNAYGGGNAPNFTDISEDDGVLPF